MHYCKKPYKTSPLFMTSTHTKTLIRDDRMPFMCESKHLGDEMSRRTITIEPQLDQIINFVRGSFLIIGQEYNYTEVVNHAIFYGICYWLRIPHEQAVQLAPEVLTTNLKLEGMKDEERDKMVKEILSKLQPLKK